MQTSVEQLMIALYEGGYLRGNGNEMDDILEKYKEIEKQQIEKTFDNAVESEILGKKITGEQYYNNTYGSKGSNEHIEDNLDEIATSSHIEISDEEIEKAIIDQDVVKQEGYCHCFLEGAKWYREQLKSRQ